MSATPVVFSATGTIQSYVVPTAGTYVIEAAGGEGGEGATPGAKGSRVSGMFHLKRGESLKIVVGRLGAAASPPHELSGNRGGSSLVWSGANDLPNPIKLLLSARGGRGGDATAPELVRTAVLSDGRDDAGAAVNARELAASVGDLDQPTADSLATVWTAGAGSSSSRSVAGAESADSSGYNAGAFRRNTPDVQSGHGYVSITPVTVPASPRAADVAPGRDPAPDSAAKAASPVNPDPTASVPSPTVIPQVTPRPGSWARFLRRRP